MKTQIKLNERQLRRIISESIKNTLLEYELSDFTTDKDMIRFNIIGYFSNVIGKVKRRVKELCENNIRPNSVEERALSCISEVEKYFSQGYEKGRERGLLLEYWTDYGDTPPDTRSTDEKVTSEMAYFRNVMQSQRDSIERIYKSSKMDLKELGTFGVALFDGMLKILSKYGF